MDSQPTLCCVAPCWWQCGANYSLRDCSSSCPKGGKGCQVGAKGGQKCRAKNSKWLHVMPYATSSIKLQLYNIVQHQSRPRKTHSRSLCGHNRMPQKMSRKIITVFDVNDVLTIMNIYQSVAHVI